MELKTIKEIKEDLKDIKYYYSRKKSLDEAFRNVGYNSVVKKVELYTELIKNAPPQFYDLYISLYVNNHTQESLSEQICYTRESVNLLNKKLITYLLKEINKKLEEGNESN